MNLEKLNHWLALAANLGVIIGIIVVVIELNQTQVSLQTEASTTRTLMAVEHRKIYRDNGVEEIIFKLNNDLVLTSDEELKGLEWIEYILRYFENLHYQNQQGVLDQEIWEANLTGIQAVCTGSIFKYFFDWPNDYGSGTYRKSFVELIMEPCS